jgi:hypothetical protein
MSAAKCETGWGDSPSSRTVPELRDHPTPPLRVDPPPPGEGKRRVLVVTTFSLNVVPAMWGHT